MRSLWLRPAQYYIAERHRSAPEMLGISVDWDHTLVPDLTDIPDELIEAESEVFSEISDIVDPEFIQADRILSGLASRCRKEAILRGLNAAAYRDQILRPACDFYSDILLAFKTNASSGSPEMQDTLWSHPDLRRLMRDEFYLKRIDKRFLISAATTYLRNPWMSLSEIDWIIADALVCTELNAWLLNTFRFLQRDREARGKRQIIKALVFFGVSGAISATTAYFSMLSGVAVAVCFLAISIAVCISNRNVKKRNGKIADSFGVLWNCLTPPCFSPTVLREELMRSISKGVMLDSIIFPIVERMIQKDPCILDVYGK